MVLFDSQTILCCIPFLNTATCKQWDLNLTPTRALTCLSIFVCDCWDDQEASTPWIRASFWKLALMGSSCAASLNRIGGNRNWTLKKGCCWQQVIKTGFRVFHTSFCNYIFSLFFAKGQIKKKKKKSILLSKNNFYFMMMLYISSTFNVSRTLKGEINSTPTLNNSIETLQTECSKPAGDLWIELQWNKHNLKNVFCWKMNILKQKPDKNLHPC